MTVDLDSIFRAVRESTTPTIWSKGVELARQDAVFGERANTDEIKLRVKTSESAISPVVTIYPEDEDWQCSCSSDDDPCLHVIAAVIALRRASERGQTLPQSEAVGGRLTYNLRRQNGQLLLERWVIKDSDASKSLLETSLTALAAGRVKGPAVSATSEDIEIDLALAGTYTGPVKAQAWPSLCKTLSRVEGVCLDGQPVTVRDQPVGIRLVVIDAGPGVKAYGEQDPDIEELFANGCARCRSGLRPVVLPQLPPALQELLRSGRYFARQEVAELVGEILPVLEPLVPIDIRTQRLPGQARQRPRLELQLDREANGLTATPHIVYGDPVIARVQFGHLVATGSAVVPVRDIAAERILRDRLERELGLELDKTIKLAVNEALLFTERLSRFDGDLVGDGYAAFRRYPPLQASLQIHDDGLTLDFTSITSDRPSDADPDALMPSMARRHADPGAVLGAWRAGEGLVPLLEGGFAPLPQDWLTRFGPSIEALLAARVGSNELNEGLKLQVPHAARPLLVDLCDQLGQEPPPALGQLRQKLEHFEQIPNAILPADLAAELRPYQRAGVDWLHFTRSLGFGALLADDMGLGKTLQTLAAMQGRCLVVAPTSVVFNWVAEIRKFRPRLNVTLYHGLDRELDPEADVTVTTYALLRLDLAKLGNVSWDMLVLDEAQAVKNPDSQAAKAAQQIHATFKVALTGTPVENRLEDLYSQMQIINPGLLGTRRYFLDAYARPIASGDKSAASTLRARIKPFILRRLKHEVAKDLPPRTETVLHVELSASERRHYDAVHAATRADVVAKLAAGGSVIEALEALLRLRQACCHPDLLPGISGQSSAKLGVLVETLQETTAEGHKTLVFTQWTSFLDLMEPALATAGIGYLRLDGSTKDRGAIVAAFQAPEGPPVLLMSLKAGGVGLNLTAADHVIITDPWWNPAAEDQAADRAHRIGQDRPVLVQRLVALQTVEERILALQEHKRQLANAVLEQGNVGQVGLTKGDLLALLDP